MDAILGADVNAVVGSDLRGTISLSGAWRVKTDPDNRGMAAGWASRSLETDCKLIVPGCVQSIDELAEPYPPANGHHNSYLGTVWLERAFPLPMIDRQQRLWLKIGGVAPAAHLWLNGHYIGYHGCGPVSAKWDITDYALGEAVNRVTVAIVEQDQELLGGLRFDGQAWSGLYRAVELETTSGVHVESLSIACDGSRKAISLSAEIHNDGTTTVDVAPSVNVIPWPGGPILADRGELTARLRPGERCPFSIQTELPTAHTWSIDAPHLNIATVTLKVDGASVDAVAVRFGLRSLEISGAHLLLNGQPFMARGVGQEFFSPTLSPLVDRAIIRDRIRMLKAHGFNFFRCHTYPVTPEELAMADELGFLYCSEISLISNFGRTEPFERGLDVLRAHIEQTRNHPSLGVVCLGNEGSQVMVESEQDRHNAIIGYDLIKATAHNSLAMITFGMQGELPDLPNDIASPHLWSHDSRWGYEGLTRIPWRTIHPLTTAKPSIIHEFGKFGVWPDPDEQALYPPSGYAFPFGDHAKAALIAAGLEHTEERVIANARRLHELSCRNIIEQARRQPGIDGYTVWTGFRGGARSSGFSDDLGRHSNGDPTTYREGCNAPLAVLIDRDFAGRTLAAGADTEVGLYLSNFGATAVANAVVPWQLCRSGTHSREPLVQGRVEHVSAALGQNARVGDIRFDVPHVRVPVQAVLEASVVAGGTTVARNQWDLWLFPTRSPGCDAGVVCDLADPEIERRIVAHLPNTISLRDLDSAVHGCRAWAGMEPECLARSHEGILVADRWSDATDMFLELGRTAVLLDTGHLPDSWYPPPVPGTPGSHNVLASFTSFRAGWDQGNMATIIEPHAMLGEFPHEGFCDLQCYAMVQQATPIRTRAVAAGKAVRSRRVVIRSVPKLMSSPSSPRIQDPNAIRAAEIAPGRRIATEDRAYLVEVRVGAGRLIVCTLRCLDDPAGRYLLSQILDYAGTPVAPAPYRGTTPRRPSSEWRLVRP